jgi:hypothetical protein
MGSVELGHTVWAGGCHGAPQLHHVRQVLQDGAVMLNGVPASGLPVHHHRGLEDKRGAAHRQGGIHPARQPAAQLGSEVEPMGGSSGDSRCWVASTVGGI